MTPAGLPGWYTGRGAPGLAAAGGGRTRRGGGDGKFMFITPGTLPAVSLISAQLISRHRPPPQLSGAPLITAGECRVSRAFCSGESQVLGWALLAWGTERAVRIQGLRWEGSWGYWAGTLGPCAAWEDCRRKGVLSFPSSLLQHSNFVQGYSVLAPDHRLTSADLLAVREGI